MHIPDGYLSPSTCIVFDVVMIPILYKAAQEMKKNFTADRVPKLAMASMFSFLIMMFNVPVPDGTTAHAIGATLAAILFGPWAATIAMSVALGIQAIVFGDGGILAFGANIFNMGFVAPFVGYYVYKAIGGEKALPQSMAQLWRAGFAAYIGIVAAAIFAGAEFGIQPLVAHAADGTPLYAPYPLSVSIPAMLIPHATLIGFIEGLVTALALKYAQGVLHIKEYNPAKISGGIS